MHHLKTTHQAPKLGQPIKRFEDDRLLRGQAQFSADLSDQNALSMGVLRATVAAGQIRNLDVSKARACAGVHEVLTGKDIVADGIGSFLTRLRHPGPDGDTMRVPDFFPLAIDHVRYVGDPVAIVLADTSEHAEAALDLILLEIDAQDCVVDARQALAPDAPKVWAEFPDNRCFHLEKGDGAAVSAAMDAAHHIIRQRLRLSRVTAAPMETRGLRATYDATQGRFHLETGTQTPHRIAMDLAPVLGVSVASIHVRATDAGGSFGMKNAAYPEQALALWAARRLGRCISWQATRIEAFQSDAHGRDQWADAELALDQDGRFLALRVHIVANLGAYLGPATAHPPTANLGGLAGVYQTPALHVSVDGVFTNTQFTAPYRGAGRPEATYIIERMIDLAAQELGIDRAELRLRNMITPEQMPYKTGLIFTYDSGDFPGVMRQALQDADWAGFATRQKASAARGRLRGIGIANPIEIAGGPEGKPHPEFARLELSPHGHVRLSIGSCDTGQGHATIYRQIIGEHLGIAGADIEILSGDTDQVPQGTGTFGSRTMTAAGTALVRAMDRVIDALRPLAAERLQANVTQIVFANGAFQAQGNTSTINLAAVMAGQTQPVTMDVFESAAGATFPNGCHICEVEIDPETGSVDLQSYIVVDDVGNVLNPMLVDGQISGGIAQGVGQALMEQIVHDPDTSQLLSATFMDYAMPRADNLPNLQISSLPVATLMNPLGVKGVGEAGTVGALAATISAVCDALAVRQIRHIDMPATSARIWQAMSETSLAERPYCGP